MVVETLFSATVQALVGNGVGIGFVNSYAMEESDTSRLVLKTFEPGIFARTLLIYPPDRQRSRLVSDMVEVPTAVRHKGKSTSLRGTKWREHDVVCIR